MDYPKELFDPIIIARNILINVRAEYEPLSNEIGTRAAAGINMWRRQPQAVQLAVSSQHPDRMPPDRMPRERERDRKSLSPRPSEGVRLYTNKLP